jgi:uncharacterized membrane protein YgdD (TMEM256/DUF423 family)
MMTAAFWFRVGAVLGLLSVAAGAFGAHSLRGMLRASLEAEATAGGSPPRGTVAASRRIEVFETGVRYHAYHALALLALGLLVSITGRSGMVEAVAGWAFVGGIVVFSGSLYALGYTGVGWLGAITPIGGVTLMVGWAALAVAGGPLTLR